MMKTTRRQLLATAAGAAAGAIAARHVPAGQTPAPVPVCKLKTIERINYQFAFGKGLRQRSVLRLTTTDGLVAGAGCGSKADLGPLRKAVAGMDLCDHAAVWKRLTTREVGDKWFRAAFDILCWDAHARAVSKPLHALLGTERQRYRPYGDERWKVGLSPDEYAKRVAGTFQRQKILCTKLHVPGTYALNRERKTDNGAEGLPLKTVLTMLRKVREAVGDKVALAYDPHPQKAAALKLEDARTVAKVLDELNYEWVECLLPPEPDRMEEWLILRKEAKLRFQREESPSQTAEEEIRWLAAGAANQVTWDCRFGGITKFLEILGWARARPEKGVVFNLHYSQPAHQQLAAAMTEAEQPWVEAVRPEGRYKDGWTTIPTWLGVEGIDWAFVEKHKVSRWGPAHEHQATLPAPPPWATSCPRAVEIEPTPPETSSSWR
jgi:L-alanine-DL-glutamate epimerase-like enolase superfamily enzyme